MLDRDNNRGNFDFSEFERAQKNWEFKQASISRAEIELTRIVEAVSREFTRADRDSWSSVDLSGDPFSADSEEVYKLEQHAYRALFPEWDPRGAEGAQGKSAVISSPIIRRVETDHGEKAEIHLLMQFKSEEPGQNSGDQVTFWNYKDAVKLERPWKLSSPVAIELWTSVQEKGLTFRPIYSSEAVEEIVGNILSCEFPLTDDVRSKLRQALRVPARSESEIEIKPPENPDDQMPGYVLARAVPGRSASNPWSLVRLGVNELGRLSARVIRRSA